MNRPDWDTFWMTLCFLIAQKSPDAQTKHGSILVNEHNEVLSMGYNGFPKGQNDEALPDTRPEKYFYVLHSESNCLDFAPKISREEKAKCKIYITGHPCHECFKRILQHGIGEIVYGHVGSACMQEDPEYYDKMYMMLRNSNTKLTEFKRDAADLKTLLSNTIDYIDNKNG